MSWAKLDDRWHDCPEMNGLSDAATALWLRLQSRVAAIASDGALTEMDMERLDLSRPRVDRERAPWPEIIAELESRSLLVRVGDGYIDPAWLERNPSAEESRLNTEWASLRRQQSRAKARKDALLLEQIEARTGVVKLDLYDARARRETGLVTSAVTSAVTRDVTSAAHRPDQTRPDQSRPVAKRKGKRTGAAGRSACAPRPPRQKNEKALAAAKPPAAPRTPPPPKHLCAGCHEQPVPYAGATCATCTSKCAAPGCDERRQRHYLLCQPHIDEALADGQVVEKRPGWNIR